MSYLLLCAVSNLGTSPIGHSGMTSFRKSGKLFTAGIDRNCFRVEMFGTLWTLPKSSLDCVTKAGTDTM